MSGMLTAPYQEFAREKLGFEYKNIDYLVTALTHRSYVNEHKKSVSEHNERLEFLGDAVLELVVTDYLFRNFSDPEGTLTSWRAALVRTESIGAAGDKLGYDAGQYRRFDLPVVAQRDGLVGRAHRIASAALSFEGLARRGRL